MGVFDALSSFAKAVNPVASLALTAYGLYNASQSSKHGYADPAVLREEAWQHAELRRDSRASRKRRGRDSGYIRERGSGRNKDWK